jgi:hypothetical protein
MDSLKHPDDGNWVTNAWIVGFRLKIHKNKLKIGKEMVIRLQEPK